MVGIGSNLWSWQRAQLAVSARIDAGHRVDLLVDVVHDEADLEPLVDVLDAQRQETGGDQLLGPAPPAWPPAAGRRRSARG